ncbi:MAG: hypothetical protein A2Z11_04820 [Candidatus Woykebacteria bacterium RBG_16_43_9]|uniref:PABS domain-containing protein n=1 Tax=Candidatus Woykebacteria bacterium RBG_16_43_9 TaxID=1802596 RepID=A0A1G1WBR1_9BACT|nr:MAG: hypothetical protein A2Z11_04820 [Candidatus Woykebacteria bacterium RBG_16_43_9]
MSIWEKILYKGHSRYNGEIKVSENSGVRRLIAGANTQSQSLNSDGKTGHRYWDNMVPDNIHLGADSRVLILGLGGGTTAKIITNRFGSLAIDGVDIDPLMVELGKRYFEMNQPNLKIHIADADTFLDETRYKYDLICVDVFVAGEVPKKIETKEFFNKVKRVLSKEGVCTINKIFSGKNELEGFEDLVRGVFPIVQSRVVRGDPRLDNVIVYARS